MKSILHRHNVLWRKKNSNQHHYQLAWKRLKPFRIFRKLLLFCQSDSHRDLQFAICCFPPPSDLTTYLLRMVLVDKLSSPCGDRSTTVVCCPLSRLEACRISRVRSCFLPRHKGSCSTPATPTNFLPLERTSNIATAQRPWQQWFL